ncbi:LysE/ArgO family amino acid transporter [Desulfovibrio sp. OttesenSCG-928-I05]|nr:LysE/ArgO family amino acid transporter [Desulfovibrio sp. OttesenSCG-928-I05]
MDTAAYAQGIFMGASLIIAIGAQNAFVLTQAVRRNHALPVAAVCAFIDVALITAGVMGLGALVANNAILKGAAALGGAAFLIWFGARSLAEAFASHSLEANAASGSDARLGPTLAATLAVSLLNPHVYLDTVVMLGAISGNFPGDGRYWFGAGAGTASVVWFFGLSLAGSALAPVFRKPGAWRVMHALVCLMVWWIAGGLLYGFFMES